MLRILLSFTLLIFSFLAQAKTENVVVRGYGSSYSAALDQAKKNAVEVVTGAWISSEDSLIDNKFSNKSSSFTTGVIESYDLLKSTPHYVEIRATVVEGRNRQLVSSSNSLTKEETLYLKQLRQNTEDQEKIFTTLDSVDSAFEFFIRTLVIESSGKNVTVVGNMQFKESWKAQYDGFILKGRKDLPLLHLGKCQYEIEGKITFYDHSMKVIYEEQVVFNIPYRKFLTKDLLPQLQSKQEYVFTRTIPEDFKSVEVFLHCTK